MSTLRKAQILLENDQHKALAKIAKDENCSISDVVREIIRIHLKDREQKSETYAALQALEELKAMRAKIQEEHGIYHGDLLDEARFERENDFDRIWRSEE